MKRDADLKEAYVSLCDQNPGQPDSVYYAVLSERFYITERTIYAILSGEYERTLNRSKIEAADPNQLTIFIESAD
ncbi:hypothetical protein [Nodularia spumigena]|uniref:hypothetical protein n=1 Tax=Nodularia spumigena TaxID=70799 RepID=UPI0023305F29|nr:hypothetical protein [Nodularia spumigena]MDB9500051.1 hypothetical protein [Nodularia spumigena CS-336/02]